MDTILEQQRQLHEERERLVDATMEEYLLKKPTRREIINSDHRINDFNHRYRDVTVELQKLYTDKSGQRKQAVDFMNGIEHRAKPFNAFYDKLNELEKRHENLSIKKNQVIAQLPTPEASFGAAVFGTGKDGKNQPSESTQLGSLFWEFDSYRNLF